MITVEEYVVVRNKKIEDVNFTIRGYNSLKRAGYCSLGQIIDDLISGTLETKFLKVRNSSRKSLAEVKRELSKQVLPETEINFYGDFQELIDALVDLDKSAGKLKNAYELFNKLCAQGLEVLKNEPKENFSAESDEYDVISKEVEKYLNYLAKEMVKAKKPKKQIEETIQSKIEEFKKIVDDKRYELDGSAFLSKMAEKISEIRKYKRSTKTHKEEKELNPFYNDGETI